MMRFNKSAAKTLGALIFVGLFAFWFIGWESIRYDKDDENIGRKIIFTETMLLLMNIPEGLAGEFIANKYGSIIENEKSWESFKAHFSDVSYKKITCDEIFIIEGVFYIEWHGVLMRGFKSDSLKYYVMSSRNINKSVIRGGNYEAYTKVNAAAVVDNNC